METLVCLGPLVTFMKRTLLLVMSPFNLQKSRVLLLIRILILIFILKTRIRTKRKTLGCKKFSFRPLPQGMFFDFLRSKILDLALGHCWSPAPERQRVLLADMVSGRAPADPLWVRPGPQRDRCMRRALDRLHRWDLSALPGAVMLSHRFAVSIRESAP